jgi:hypothetical protein
MNVKIGTEAAHFPEKEYINGIFLAGHDTANNWIVPPPCADIREKISDHDLREKNAALRQQFY